MHNIHTIITQHIVDKLGVEACQVTEQASFTDDLGADSLDVFELIAAIEKEFALKIPDEVAEKITTVGMLINYVSKHAILSAAL